MRRSRRALSNEYLLAKVGFDAAMKEPCKVCPLSVYRLLLFLLQIPQLPDLSSGCSMGRLPSSLPWHETPTPLKFSSAEERKAYVEFVDGATFVLSYETLEDIGIERSHRG